MNFYELTFSICSAALRMSAPLIFAALGGIASERSGIVNIALEGKMLVGAFFAATVTFYTHSALLGFIAGGLSGLVLAAIYAVFVIQFKSNQIVAGTAINILAAGVVPFISQIFFQNTGSTPDIPLSDRFVYFPLAFSWVCMVALWALFKFSPYGLWHKFAGEHPEALQTAGINVNTLRWSGVLLAGFLTGLGGATLSICLSSNYTRNMTAGRGFMALAALIVGNWNIAFAALACFVFGFFEAIGITLQGIQISIPSFLPILC